MPSDEDPDLALATTDVAGEDDSDSASGATADVVDNEATPVINIITDDGQQANGPTLTWEEACKCPPNKTGRNLVVCIDGTANQFSLNNTHVVELYSRLEKDDKQLTYYDSGIGTFVKPSNWIGWLIQLVLHILDMMVAWNLKSIVLSAYQWLSENYQPGDRIFLFGFSRGAYQVRIIAGMIQVVGLLHKGNNNQIAFAYELYLACVSQLSRRSPTLDSGDAQEDETIDRKDPRYPWELCKQFKRTLCHRDVRVHFVGAWDTVSSVGIARGPSLPETTTGMTHVCGFCHCISLDELRDKFLPEYGNGGHGPAGKGGFVKEVWFTGSHSDIGGGNDVNLKLTSFGPPLRWMLDEAMAAGLRVEPVIGAQWKPAKLTPSMVGFWKVLEYIPFRRLSYDESKDSEHCHSWPPNRFRGRRVQPGQFIHASVIEYMDTHPDYTPAAELNNGLQWKDFKTIPPAPHAEGPARLVAKDLYSSAPYALSVLREIVHPGKTLNTRTLRRGIDSLGRLLDSGDGQGIFAGIQDASDILIRSMEHIYQLDVLEADERDQIIDVLVRALTVYPSRPSDCLPVANSKLQRWLAATSEDIRERVVRTFGNGPLYGPWNCHANTSSSVAYSPDGKVIASGANDSTVLLWDAATGQLAGEPLQGHEHLVCSVAFSPDGKRIVSGSYDCTIRIWNAETRQPVGAPLTGHEDDVNSVTFSPDDKLISSGSHDKTVRIWDAQTGRAVGEPLRGHTDWVRSVAFSPNGRRIASGSEDGTVCIWDVETRGVVRVLEGHSRSVSSVVFSPDGRRIVSGSGDRTIRLWGAETGETVLGPLEGHTGFVRAVAVSPDGRYIASGSYDNTVRLWSARTGEAVGEPLRGHTKGVNSVAFSPDSRCIVSGSHDESLMIWEVA